MSRTPRPGFTSRRRQALTRRFALERFEPRSTATPVSLAAFAVGVSPIAAELGSMHVQGGGSNLMAALAPTGGMGRASLVDRSIDPAAGTESIAIVPRGAGEGPGGGGALPDVPQVEGSPAGGTANAGNDAIARIHSLGAAGDGAGSWPGLSSSWKPARSVGAGGGALPPRGGSGGTSGSYARSPRPTGAAGLAGNSGSSSSAASASAASALLSTLGLDGSASSSAPATTITRNAPAASLRGGPVPASSPTGGGGIIVTPQSAAFTLVTLDYNDGSVFVPGAEQLATPGGSVDLRAQVIDSASGTYTYSWNTSGLTDANSISGTGSYDLTFQWNTTIATAKAESVTLTVTDPNSNQVSQTYTFWVPATTGTATGDTAWPSSLDPGLISAGASSVASKNVSVVSATGAAMTSINLPSFNPNVAPVSLAYSSLSANALPIIDVEHPLDPTKSTPSQVTAQLDFNGTYGSTAYYNTSSYTPGDIMQIGLQANASSLSTGRYSYSATVVDERATPTTTTYSGTATIINEAKDPTFSALGAGWTISGLEKIIPASGGVILDEGAGIGAWFSGSFGAGGGTYTSPAGDFSTLVLNSNGTYSRTLTDGTVENFNSSGLETTVVDRNGLTTTFGYSSSRLQTITDPFNEVTTFTYNGSNLLQSIEDSDNRLTTFTISGGDLTAVEYPDGSTWDYGYGANQLTNVTEPSSAGEPTKITTITYDSANRVGTIMRADSTTEEFSAAQEQGWSTGSTSTSPATPTLLGQVGSTYTDPLGNVTTSRPDWRGMGLTNQTVDALGNVATVDRDANGLATISVDPMNRITQTAYDSKANVTKVVNPDGSTVTYGSYNSFAEPSSMTDELGRKTTYTYDSHGNMTVLEDPATNVTTYTYSSTQPGMLTAQTAPAPAGHSSDTLFSYQYDSKDRLTTITNADSDVTVKGYNNAGQVTSITDPNGNVTTYSYDQMNRKTGETDAAGTSIAGVNTYTYDAVGNQVTSTNPDNYTTTTTYDALDRQATVKNPDGGVTTYTYDNAGRLYVLEDSVHNRTTFLYDSLGRQTTQISPSVNNSGGVTSTTAYNADGEVTQTTDANGRTVTYSYDSRGDQTGETWLNSSGGAIYVATYTYDSAKEMTGAADSNSLITIAYDSDGRVGTIATSGPGSGQPTVTLTYGYDPSGDVTSITDSLSGTGGASQGITSYAYDPALRLTTITQSFGGTAGPQIVYSYDPGGRITEMDRTIGGSGTDVYTTYAYDAQNNVTAINSTSKSLALSPSQYVDISNTIDPADRVTTVTFNNNGSSTSTTYSYDQSGQVTGSTGSSNNSYSYDLNGNPNSTGFTTGAGNELTNSPGVTYTYDNDGNIVSATTSSGTTTYTYDYANRITSVDQNGTVIASYTYDALGRRIAMDDNGTKTWTVYNGTSADANPYADFTSSGSVSERYLFGPAAASNAILARTSSSAVTDWYYTNDLGSVNYIVDTGGFALDTIVYDPFGNIVSESSPSSGDRFKFAGMQYDSATGIYYDHARYYDAAIERFASQDPMRFAARDTNLYRYVLNDPVGATDASGLIDVQSIVGGLAGALGGAAGGQFGGMIGPNLPIQDSPIVGGLLWGAQNGGVVGVNVGVVLGGGTLQPVIQGGVGGALGGGTGGAVGSALGGGKTGQVVGAIVGGVIGYWGGS